VEILSALDAATDEFGRRLARVDEASWSLSTPCADWDVHYLVAHVVGGNRFANAVLGGMPASDAIAQVMSSSQLEPDAMTAWTTTSATQTAAFRAVTSLDSRVDHPLGKITGREFLEFRVFDITVHAWDLARSIGADDRLAPDLVDTVLDIVQDGPSGMGFGIVALDNASQIAPAQARLLALTGRESI